MFDKITKKNRPSHVQIYIVESEKTKEKYVVLLIDDEPYKFWNCKDLGSAGMDFIINLITMYDYGYNILFQFPKDTVDGRCIVPEKVKLPWEPALNTDPKNINDLKLFYSSDVKTIFDNLDNLEISLPDRDQNEMLNNYINNHNLNK